jgi:putative nucleotidyltransferase with HDIG domain
VKDKCSKSREFIEEKEKECEDCNKERKFCELRAELKSDAIQDCINKIMNTLAFRKLAGKTQVILSINGPDIRTRLTHTMEVVNIARDLCTKLGLNSELAEAMALAHDIGHTPFGHVGERCLRDIVCGCNSLGDMIPEDLENSGFKHNLQGVRVLTTLENVVPKKRAKKGAKKDTKKWEEEKAWDKILWGILAHTSMTWAKKLPGLLDDLIFIPSALCPRVFNCHFNKHQKQENDGVVINECHRNKKHERKKDNEEREDKGKEDEQEICHPWLCAVAFSENNSKIEKYIRCKELCYIANLWKIKFKCLKKNQNHILEYPILFDHPVPGIFYSSELLRFHSNDGNDSSSGNSDDSQVSLEALVVRQADEIAQRLQDMEDGVNKGLILIDGAESHFWTLCIAFKAPSEKGLSVLSEYSTACGLGDIPFADYLHKEGTEKLEEVYSVFQEKQKNSSKRNRLKILREYLYKFYSERLLCSSRENLSVFMGSKIPKGEIDPYVLLDEFQKVYLKNKSEKRASWYLKLLDSEQGEKEKRILYWNAYCFLEELVKINDYKSGREILQKLSQVLGCLLSEEEKNKYPPEVAFNLQMDKIREKVQKTKEIQLQLFHYFILDNFYLKFKSRIDNNDFPSKEEFTVSYNEGQKNLSADVTIQHKKNERG